MPGKSANASDAATSARLTSSGLVPILLFDGTGTSPGDVAAVETILNSNHLNYSTVNSSQLNHISESQLRGYRLLIVPGGNFVNIGNSLNASTTPTIRNAVQNGLNYLGICGGGFFAGNSGYYNGLNLTSGVSFSFYSAENQGIRKAAVAIAGPGAPTLDHIHSRKFRRVSLEPYRLDTKWTLRKRQKLDSGFGVARDFGVEAWALNGHYCRPSMKLIWVDFLDPVSLLEIHQPVSLAKESFCVAMVTFLPQVLTDQIEHGGSRAEVVVNLDMKL